MARALRIGDVVRHRAGVLWPGSRHEARVLWVSSEGRGAWALVVQTDAGLAPAGLLERRTKKGRWKLAGPLKGAR